MAATERSTVAGSGDGMIRRQHRQARRCKIDPASLRPARAANIAIADDGRQRGRGYRAVSGATGLRTLRRRRAPAGF